MITTYNLKACGDILVIVLAPNADKQQVTTNGQVTRIQDRDTKKQQDLILLVWANN